MNSTPQHDRVFPLTGGSSERPVLRAPRLGTLVRPNIGLVMGNRAFMRAWAARRAAMAIAHACEPQQNLAAR